MQDKTDFSEFDFNTAENVKKKSPVFINIILFIATFFTTTLAGVAWANQDPYQLENIMTGITYSVLIMLVISAHEFGHYFAAKYHKVSVTLPYYIPFPFLFLNPFGTMGAVIRMRAVTQSRNSLFDIGVAGPIAGWVVSIVILIIGFATLPPVEYLYNIHPEYRYWGISTKGLTFGYNLIFLLFEKVTHIFSPNAFVPPMNEMYHYPYLVVGWFGLLITALNMMPVGQLDGGHISYAMFGKRHKTIAWIVFYLLVLFGALGSLEFLFPDIRIGSFNWLVWAGLIYFVIKVEHPPLIGDFSQKLDTKRTLLGWFSFFIFITSFCPIPITDI